MRLDAAWVRRVHHLMQTAQQRHLAARSEGRLGRDDRRDGLAALGGAGAMAVSALTPFLRRLRAQWGLDADAAKRRHPGDELVPEPRWGWTHAVEVAAAAEAVWPWIAQIGADRGGFYSYQWLENVAGCQVHNAETIHPEWAVREGDDLRLHPKQPPLRVVSVVPGRYFVAHGAPDGPARAANRRWFAVSWLFLVEPLDRRRSRVISRFRSAYSDDLATRLAYGPALLEPVGFAMDRRMLLGIKERAESGAQSH